MSTTVLFGTPQERRTQLTLTDDYTITNSDFVKDINIATDAKTITLPLITTQILGVDILIRNTGADANNIVTISPNALDGINGSLPASLGANADATTADGLISKAGGVVNKNFVNTKATANIGDFVVLRAVALTKWFIVGGVGVWASEA